MEVGEEAGVDGGWRGMDLYHHQLPCLLRQLRHNPGAQVPVPSSNTAG